MNDYETISRHIEETVKIGESVILIEMRWDWVEGEEAGERMELRIANMGDDRPFLRITGLDGASLPELAQALLTLSDIVALTPHELATR